MTWFVIPPSSLFSSGLRSPLFLAGWYKCKQPAGPVHRPWGDNGLSRPLLPCKCRLRVGGQAQWLTATCHRNTRQSFVEISCETPPRLANTDLGSCHTRASIISSFLLVSPRAYPLPDTTKDRPIIPTPNEIFMPPANNPPPLSSPPPRSLKTTVSH